LFQVRSNTGRPGVAYVATGAAAAARSPADDPDPVRARGSSRDQALAEQLLGAVCPPPVLLVVWRKNRANS
jgi:hypothetical protein